MTPPAGPLDSAAPEPRDGEDEYAVSPLLLALETPIRSPGAVAIHEMAAQLLAQQVDQGRRGLAVCGVSRMVGVSLVAMNLAIALAQAGASVMLVDGNLHQPAIDTLLRPSRPAIGLQQMLRDPKLTLMDVVHHDVVPGLSILFSGGPARDASELIAGSLCEQALSDCLRDYEYTIVDTPAANRSPDARRLAGIVGYGLIVARRNETYVDDVATLADELAFDRVAVVATLFNAL